MNLVDVREGVWANLWEALAAFHRFVHAPERKRPLNELGFPRFPQPPPAAELEVRLYRKSAPIHCLGSYLPVALVGPEPVVFINVIFDPCP